MVKDGSRARSLADNLEKRFPEDTSVRLNYLPVIRARLELNRGDSSRAIDLLQVTVPHELGQPRSAAHGAFGALYPIYLRGEARLQQRNGAEAAHEFQKVRDHLGVVVSDPIGALARLQLGRAFVLSDDSAKARAAYQDLLTQWKDADRDIPIVKQAKAEYAKLQ